MAITKKEKGCRMVNSEQTGEGSARVPGTRRKAVPIAMAFGPQDYTPGDQEFPVQLTSLADMLRSRNDRIGFGPTV
jgi:hypothetical protein